MQHLAIFGGTFDPIHLGHIKTSLHLQSYFKFDKYIFLPCKIPVLKSPSLANAEQRTHMLKLALSPYPMFNLDLREIKRTTPSYMIDTLSDFRLQYPQDSLNLIIGYDALLSLPQWHQWEKLIRLANFIVINRKAFDEQKIPPLLKIVLKTHQCRNKDEILSKKAGAFFFFDAGDYDISSSSIREAIKREQSVMDLLPIEILSYIKQEKLYR